ncbi:DUF5641 domain-containing protein [Trichonephila clavipes]|nr:DUF5641 domain-containing protein [Trichonephila clavipes]
MVAARSPAESRFKVWDLGSSQSVSVSVRVCPNRVASRFYSTTFYSKILERTICLVHLIASDWSRTSAELPGKVHCLIEARENPMTHPNIYECNDPPRCGNIGDYWTKRLQWPLARVIKLIRRKDGLVRTVKLKTQSCTLILQFKVFPLKVSGNDIKNPSLQKVQQTDSSVSYPNPDTLKATEKPLVTRCGRPV